MMFGVVSVAVTTSRALRVRYTTPVWLIRMKSPTGLTVTEKVAVPARPLALLVAVTVKVSTAGAAPVGIDGATKLWIEPSVAPDTRVVPVGAVQV